MAPTSKTLYTPNFHPPPSQPPSAFLRALSKQHLLLASLPADYSPPPSPPLSLAKVTALEQSFIAGGYQWETMRLGCVRGGYPPPPLIPTVRTSTDADAEDAREWCLPDTEEEGV